MESEEQNMAKLEGVQNSLYYVLFAIQSVAAIMSILVVIGLLIPLYIQLKNGTFREFDRSSRRSSSTRRRSSAGGMVYSTYNLYLVHLALVDVVFLLSCIGVEANIASQNNDSLYIPAIIADSITPSYTIANLFINAFIVREVLNLLRATKSARRITQPSLATVNLQAGIVIFLSLLYGILSYYSVELGWADGPETALTIFGIPCLVPLLYVVGVTILVKCKGYMPPIDDATPRNKAVRGLARYFFRVIVVFVVIWLPAAVLSSASRRAISIGRSQILLILAQCVMASQPILTFCIILTKPDVKKYITDLFAPLSCMFGASNCRSKNESPKTGSVIVNLKQNDSTIFPGANQGQARRKSATILGYTFSDLDGDGDSESGSHPDAERVDSTKDHVTSDAETGNAKYKSHQVGESPAAVMTTGESVSVSAETQ